MDQNDFLWGLCKENLVYCRHHEQQREAVARLILIVASILLGLVALDNSLTAFDIPFGFFMTLLGIFGAVFTNKHYERFDHHYERFRYLRGELQSRLEVEVNAIQQMADQNTLARWPRLAQMGPNRFWRGFHICISIIGVAIILGALLLK